MTDESLRFAQARGIRAWLGTDHRSHNSMFHVGEQQESDVPWLQLKEGDRVRVHGPGSTLTGIVDCVMADGSIFWMWQDSGAGRTAIHEEDGFIVEII